MLILLGMFLLPVILLAGDFPPWEVPADAKGVTNPVAKSKGGLDAGRNLYNTQCKACHGEAGDGKGAIKAANLTTAEFQAQTDGAIHHKLIAGRGLMPSFKTLPETDLWNVIHFLRTFGESAVKVVRKPAILVLQLDEQGGKKKLVAIVNEKLSSGGTIPAQGVSVGFFSKSYFGLLNLSKTSVRTNEKGYASIDLPEGIPGDTALNLTLVARIDDSEYVPAEASQTAKWGIAPPPDRWDEERQLWKNNHFVPYWLLLTFGGLLLGVFAGVGYVASLVWKIKQLGDQA